MELAMSTNVDHLADDRYSRENSASQELSGINERFYWTFTVGPAGGIFRVMNIILSIPKDAVDKDVTIKIAVSHNDQDRPPQKI
ncbi:hypothetical protein NP493_1443g00074 [Ridgeia piscesae]|uniref:Uncharacterized protein n=1 Tax=Ridgeia piscesae TaxID=27915 RepID=A0AAD9K3K0_RIDPI|nr:hypothetical protein NP493_1443g00074 [Ridgeia piscesae]